MRFLLLGAVAAPLLASSVALAQAYPSKPVRVVLTISGGGETNARVVMDKMTQQNAALVEQASAASHSMADQARSLSQMMARYQLGDARAPMQATPAAVGPATDRKATTAGRSKERQKLRRA